MKTVLALVVFISLGCNCPALSSKSITFNLDSDIHTIGQQAVVKVDIETDVPVSCIAFDIVCGGGVFLSSSPSAEGSAFLKVNMSRTYYGAYYYECIAPNSSEGFVGKGLVTTLTFQCLLPGEAFLALSRFGAVGPDYKEVGPFEIQKNNGDWFNFAITPVPEPSSLLSLGGCLIVLVGLAFRRRV